MKAQDLADTARTLVAGDMPGIKVAISAFRAPASQLPWALKFSLPSRDPATGTGDLGGHEPRRGAAQHALLHFCRVTLTRSVVPSGDKILWWRTR